MFTLESISRLSTLNRLQSDAIAYGLTTFPPSIHTTSSSNSEMARMQSRYRRVEAYSLSLSRSVTSDDRKPPMSSSSCRMEVFKALSRRRGSSSAWVIEGSSASVF